jgi:hypothetical protein
VRWSYERAALSYFNPYAEPTAFDLRLNLVAAAPREVVLHWQGRELKRVPVGTEGVALTVLGLVLAPGVNLFTLDSPAGAIRQGEGRNQLRSIGLRGSSVKLTATGAVPGEIAAPAVAKKTGAE